MDKKVFEQCTKSIRVLYIEDDESSKKQGVKLLKAYFNHIDTADDGKDGLEKYHQAHKQGKPYDLVISDINMPRLNGISMASRIRKIYPEVPIVFLTAYDDTYYLDEAIKIGATGFITKPFSKATMDDEMNHILMAVCSHKLLVKYINRIKLLNAILSKKNHLLELKNQQLFFLNKKLEIISITDELTQTKNRRFLIETIEEKINKKQGFVIALIDIDDFKQINDQYGHLIGDEVLKQFAQTIADLIKPTDILGRWGGEEFLVIFNQSDLNKVCQRIEEIKAKIEQSQFIKHLKVTASFGVTQYLPGTEDSVDQVIRRADDALYRAKENGKNQICQN